VAVAGRRGQVTGRREHGARFGHASVVYELALER
jgi:hypothetical protein